MSAGETTQFKAIGGCGNYEWSIISGGGSFSPVYGSPVNYTAPTSNPNCKYNTLICVTDSAGQKTYKWVAINAANNISTVYIYKACNTGWSCNLANSYWNETCAIVNVIAGQCNGTESLAWSCGFGGSYRTNADPTHCKLCESINRNSCEAAALASAYSNDCNYSGLYPSALNVVVDSRTSNLLSSGCCPARLLPPDPPPVTVPSCSVCDLQINKFDVLSAVVDQNGSVNFTGNISSSKPFSWKVTIGGNVIGSGTSAAVKASWNLKNENFKLGQSKKYTATLTVRSDDDSSCTDSENQNFTIKYREKDCKLEITANSSISAVTGNFSHSQNLFTVPGSSLMSDFTLYYNSTDSYSGILGSSWTHTYNIFLSTDPTDDAYILSDGQGGVISLYRNGDYYTSDISAYPMLQANADGTYTLIYKNDTAYTFNSNGRVNAIADKNGNTIHLTYNTPGNLIKINDATGKTIYLNYDESNRISVITDPNNNGYTFTYNGNMLSQVSSNNSLGTQTWKYTYDDNAFMLTKTDPQGNLVQYYYDAEQRVSQTIDPQGGTINVQYDPENNTTTVTEKDGGVWLYRYDSSPGVLKSKTDPSGGTTSYEYDTNRNLTSKIEADGTATSYTYDASGNMTSVTDAAGNTSTYTYNEQNLVTGITDSTGKLTKYTYDTRGNILSTTDPAGAITQYTYDSKGNIISITAPNGGTTTMAYDANNNLISVTDPSGQTTTQTYDNSGNMTSQTDANGTTTFQYNSLNQLIAVTDSTGKQTKYTYDANGNRLSSTDANGNTTTYDYNYKNQLIQTTDAAGFKTAFTYGTGGCSSCGGGSDKLTSITDAKNQTTSYQYDQNGRLIKETDPLGNSTSYTYDAKGNMISRTKPDGRIITYTYDELNRLVGKNYSNGTSDVYQYDASGNITAATNSNVAYYYSYDSANRVTGVTYTNLSHVLNIDYQYDIMGNRVMMTTPDGQNIKYLYNQNNQLTKMETAKGNYTFAYDTLGRRIKRTLPNDSYTTYTYDQLSRLTNIMHKNAFNITIDAFSYTLDNIGNRLTKKDIIKTISYNYDQLYRLTRATPKSNNPLIQLLDDILKLNTESYTYDPVGNRNSGPKSSNWTYNANNELLSLSGSTGQSSSTTYQYDANGNLVKKTETLPGLIKTTSITTYAYDDENRLIYVKIQQGTKIKEVTFTYDPFGRRISKVLERDDFNINLLNPPSYPQITNYVYDEQNIVAEYDQNNKQIATYVHGPNIDEPLSAEIRNNRIYYHADGLGSITALTNHMGMTIQKYDYDAFGNIKCTPFPQWIKQPYMYTAREFDPETNLYYYRARYYNPKAGRFITKDPIGFGGGDYNLYNYVGANPVNWTDPFGLWVSYIHKNITRSAAINLGCGKKAEALAEANASVDNNQDPEEAYRHAMSNGNDPASLANDIAKYYGIINKGNSSCNIGDIAAALHAVQDSTTPAHSGFKPWSNRWWEYPKHFGDLFPSSKCVDAYNSTNTILSGAIRRCPCFCE